MASSSTSNQPPNLITITSPTHFTSLLSADLTRTSVLNFWASWAKPCEGMNAVLAEMAGKPEFEKVLFLMIEADEMDEIAESFEIEEVPTFLVLRGHTLLARHSGSNAQLLLSLVQTHATPSGTPKSVLQSTTNKTLSAPSTPSDPNTTTPANSTSATSTEEETPEALERRCHALMNKHKVVLFMKGNPSAPKCGFSRQTVGLLREKGVEFAWFDILSDLGVREGLKKMNDWPTFPQIILNGELVGGLDIFRESLENGEWDEMYNADAEQEDGGDGKAAGAVTE